MGARRNSNPSTHELRISVGQFLDEVEYTWSPNTYRNYRHDVGHVFLDWMANAGVVTVEAVTRELMVNYLRDQRNATYTRKNVPGVIHRVLPRTVEMRYTTAKKFFNWCVEQRIIGESPMATIKAPPAENRARYAFTSDEAKQLVRVAGQAPGALGLRDRAMVMTLFGTGARAGELLAMSTECRRCPGGCVRWAENRIILHGKGGKDRRLRMSRELKKAIKDWLPHRAPNPEGWIWTTQRRSVFSTNSLATWAKQLGRWADVEHVHPHRFRHTFATEFFRAHRDIKALQSRLGHTKVSITERYLNALGVDYGLDDGYDTPDTWLS